MGRQRERTLLGYLVLPRPADLIKAWIFPSALLLGLLAGAGVEGDRLARGLAVWAVLELLIYQARYQWNDILGFHADQQHPDAVARGRLPGPASRARSRVAASGAVALLRLAVAGLIVVLIPGGDLAAPVVALTISVFAVAAVYEALRKRTAPLGDPVRSRIGPVVASIWVVVGAGYVIRGMAGLAMGIALGSRPGLTVAAGLSLWAFGVAFVTIRWALEALPFARVEAGRLMWAAGQSRSRAHSLALARWLPDRPPPGFTTEQLRAWRPLAGRTPAGAPWNVATLAAATAAAVAGGLLGESSGPLATAVLGAVGAALALPALFARAGARPSAVVVGVLLLGAAAALAGVNDPVLAAVPWLLVTGSHVLFADQSLESLGRPVRAFATRRIHRGSLPEPGPAAADLRANAR